MAQNKKTYYTNHPIVRNFTVLLVILLTPPAAIIFWYTSQNLGGSFTKLYQFFSDQGFFTGLYEIWAPVFWGSKTAWAIIGIYAAVELFLMKVLPGKQSMVRRLLTDTSRFIKTTVSLHFSFP
jgi:hypothetical protein